MTDKLTDEQKANSHARACTGADLGQRLTVHVGREMTEGALYALPSRADGEPVSVHLTVLDVGRIVIPWGAITRLVPQD